MKKFLLAIALISGTWQGLQAHEGMWLPHLIGQLNHEKMTEMGLELSADEIYSINNSSLKDAIVHFNGGCTASLISDQGLLLTNHHCGYSMIQSHSSLENNYLKDGFWAMSQAEELTNPGVTASIVKYLQDITNEALEGVNRFMNEEQRAAHIDSNIREIVKNWPNPQGYELEVKPFFYGAQYILTAKEVFNDVRLVGAPPSSIGKFGADTDNWVWPRHTGDFSLFRIYTNNQNQPAEVAESNVPYRPKKHLKINLDGVQANDFTMVYGFPGSTKQYLPASEVKNTTDVYNPMRIAIRDEILAVLDKKMRKDEATRIKYASKYARISNSWKRWKGEILGIEATDAIAKIYAEEKAYQDKLDRSLNMEKFRHKLAELVLLYEKRIPVNRERYAYIEAMYYGQEMMRHLLRYQKLVELADGDNEEALAQEGQRLTKALPGFFKDFDPQLEQEVMAAVLPLYLKEVQSEPLPEAIAELKAMDPEEREEYIEELFADNPVLDEDFSQWLNEKPAKAAEKLRESAAYQLSVSSFQHFLEVLNPAIEERNDRIDALQRAYVNSLKQLYPNKAYYPDANSGLRISFGKVKGYQPKDGVYYYPRTYLEGVIEKYQPGDYEFDLPKKLLDLYAQGDYGRYAENGKLPVCFVATNHTTGGNSGSPVMNGRGELVGLNFDRAWEGVMSDMYFDTTLCRNIMVDLRYVLFIVDKFAGAQYLIDEMDLVRNPEEAVEPEKASAVETEG